MTYDRYYTDTVLDNAKTYLAALHMYDELGLKLPKEVEDEIDAELQTLIESDAQGSKTAFNALLSKYGANYTILREAYIMEAKIAQLSDHLFGADGSRISAENYENYYQENYARFRHIFFYTVNIVHEEDKNGDVIYYSDLSAKKIAYDSERDGAKKKENADGSPVKDDKGQFVWVYTDDKGVEHVSYDTKASPNPLLDENGNVITEKMTADDLRALSDKVQMIREHVKDGEYTLFDSLVEEYSEDEGMEKYPNGYYLTRTSQYDAPEVVEALFEMKEGEIRYVESDYGVHLVMKYELEEGGYAKKENVDFFGTEDGTYSFLGTLKSQLLEAYLSQYKSQIVVDEERLKSLSMKNVDANYNY
jgi:hypothetical protein